MTEQELRFILSSQDEGLRRGIEAAEKAVLGLDNAVLRLAGTQLQYNTAAQWFVDNSGRFVGDQQALAQAGIVTSSQLKDQIRLYDELIVKFQQDAVVTRQLISLKEQLQRQYSALDTAQARVSTGLKSNTQLYFQAGQAISDFAVAGIRGAANNIEFLAASLGASAPLLIGISLASAAFFVFGDDVVKALSPVSARIKEVEGAVGDLLNVIGEDRPSLQLLEKDLPSAIANVKAEIITLQAQIQGGLGSGRNDPTGLFRSGLLDSILGTKQQLKDLGLLKSVLENLEAQQEDLRVKNEVRDQLTRVRGVEEKKKEEEILETKREQLTEAQKLTEENATLAAILASIARGEIDRTEELRVQNKQLSEQVAQARKILELRSQVSGSLTGSLAIQGLQRVQASDRQVDTQSIKDLNELLKGVLTSTPGIGVIEENAGLAADNLAKMKEDARELIDLNAQLTQSIQGGLTSAFSELAGAIGEAAVSADGFKNFGATILSSLGSFAQQFGSTLIAFGTAGIAVKAFVTNPIGAIIAGGALVALGGVLKGTAKAQLDRFNAGSAQGSAATNPAVTALGFARPVESIARGAQLPVGARSGRGANTLQVEVVATESYTPAGDRVRSFRQALATEAKKGGSGKL